MHHSNMDQGPNNMPHAPIDMGGMDESREHFSQYQVGARSIQFHETGVGVASWSGVSVIRRAYLLTLSACPCF